VAITGGKASGAGHAQGSARGASDDLVVEAHPRGTA
jgi:hypothetical protein